MPKVIVEQDYNHHWPNRAVTLFRASPTVKTVKGEVAAGLVAAKRGRIVKGDDAPALPPPDETQESGVADGGDSQ